MTTTPEHRSLLRLVPHARGKRSPVTCELKCGNACAHKAPNGTDNDYFPDVASRALSRRGVLGAAGGALALALAPATAAAAAGTASGTRGHGLRFGAIDPVPATVDAVTVPKGWAWQPVIRWGDPLFADAPEFDPLHQSAAAQARQFGYNCDYLDILPMQGRRGRRALAVVNHEYTNENLMFPPTSDPAELDEQKRIAMAAHGLTVVELRRSAPGRPWTYVRDSAYNRRITVQTPFALTGPAAGHPLLQTADDPVGRVVLGTLNNCAGGTTPWGTVLSGEENFNQYFVANPSPEQARYGIPTTAGGRAWWTVDPRFDTRRPGYENEANRFGWVVEVDPEDPTSTPVKHTALGRFKHEGATIRVADDGRVVAYSGDDERFEYVYKFVSSRRMRRDDTRAARAHNKTLLTEGDLYVARFTGDSPAAEITGTGALPADGAFDGGGEWLPLVEGGVSKVAGMSVAEVLVFTRVAADRVGATKMDRPEDIEPHPVTGKVYLALHQQHQPGSGRVRRGATRPTRAPPTGTATSSSSPRPATTRRPRRSAGPSCSSAALPESAGTYFGGYTGPVSPISCPDNVAFDRSGDLWISTDGQPGTIGLDDALHRVTLTGAERGRVEQFLAVPRDAETCGPVIDSHDGMVYVCVQHPGEDGTWAQPRSFFPDYVPQGTLEDGAWGGPRPSVIQVFRRGR